MVVEVWRRAAFQPDASLEDVPLGLLFTISDRQVEVPSMKIFLQSIL